VLHCIPKITDAHRSHRYKLRVGQVGGGHYSKWWCQHCWRMTEERYQVCCSFTIIFA